jgi:Zn finger protein HypA/HybF involved in hydrogenase expression
MRIEIVLFLATAAIVWNMYTDGKFVKSLFKYTKYYRMVGVVLGALFVYYLLRKNPLKARDMIIASNEYIKNGGIGVDRTTGRWLSPLLDFTTGGGNKHTFSPSSVGVQQQVPAATAGAHMQSQRVKRSVSETKKKFVASRQQWKCLECQESLPGTFQVDHIVPLENYGTNDIQNLRALCPNCHAAKTAFDHL